MSKNKIDRESLTTSLEDRYSTQWAGGAYDVHEYLKTTGANVISVGNSYSDQAYTINKGFKLKAETMVSEFKEVDGNASKQLSRYMDGFDNTRYY